MILADTGLSLKEDLSMNAKAIFSNPAIKIGAPFLLGFTALTAAASVTMSQVAEKQPVYIMAPFTVESINPDHGTAELLTEDLQYTVKIEFDAEYFTDGNGAGHNWRDVEVKQIKDIHVYNDEEVEINAYVDRLDVVEIKDLIEQEIRERI